MKKIVPFVIILCLVSAVYLHTEAEPISWQAEIENETTHPGQITLIPCEEEPVLKSLGTFKLTAYCACSKCCGKSDGITASGARAVEGVTVAADKRFPFGTKLVIDGHEYTVHDRGGAIKSNRLDIFFDSHSEALKFGVQHKEVFVKE